MGLREIAETDLVITLEDPTFGAGWPITVTNPDGVKNCIPLFGQSDDIAQVIDPDTGQAVSGRLASAVLRISSLTAAGLELPRGIADSGQKPWLIEFDDINGNPYVFKVSESNPDRALGIVVCLLELYQ